MITEHPTMEAMIRRQFERGLSEPNRRRLQAHLRDCDRCQRLYDRYAQAEGLLYPRSEAGVNPAALERVETSLFEAQSVPPRRRSWLAPIVLGAAAASMALIAMPGGGEAPETLTARGEGSRADDAKLGLRALRIRDSEEGPVRILDLATGDPGVKAGDSVVLLYSNLGGATSIEVLLESDAGGSTRVLVPRAPIQAGAIDARLGAPLSVQTWPPGDLELVGKFAGPEGDRWTRRVRLSKVDHP